MTYETLQYVDAAGTTHEIALRLANLTGAPATRIVIEPASTAPGKCTIAWAQPPEGGLAIPFKSRCVVRANRVSTAGAADSFSGGSIVFVGRRTDVTGSASASQVSMTIVLQDVIWDLSHITLQQASNFITGGTLSVPTCTPFYWPDVVLFQAFNADYSPVPVQGTISTWQQICDILSYAESFATGADAAQFQFSPTAEFVPVYRNWYPMRSPKCWEAITNCLRTHPGVYTEVDYTTTDGSGNPLPTIHFRNRANMTALTLPYASTDASGIMHLASDIQALPELVPDAVRLFYRINSTFNGQPVAELGTDFYPAAAANSLLCQDFSIDVTGSTQTETVKNFVSSTFDPTSLALWRQKVPALHQVSQGGQIPNDGNAGALAFVSTAAYDASSNPKGIQVLGDDGVDYSSTYGTVIPYLTADDIYAWFATGGAAITVKMVTVKAYFSFSRLATAGGSTKTDTITSQQHTFRCVLCSIPSQTFILKQTLNAGEAIPTGLAQAVWTEQQDLQWRLTHQVFQIAASESALPTIVKPGKHKINLSGGRTEWTTMNAVPQRVSIELQRVLVSGTWVLAAKTSVSCGPVNHMNPDELFQLAQVFRNRDRARIDAAARLTGNGSSTRVDLSKTSGAEENSVANGELPNETNNCYVEDGIVTGQTVQSAQKVANIAVGKTPVGTADGMITMQPREVVVCDNSGDVFKVIYQATEGHVA